LVDVDEDEWEMEMHQQMRRLLIIIGICICSMGGLHIHSEKALIDRSTHYVLVLGKLCVCTQSTQAKFLVPEKQIFEFATYSKVVQ
jgi:hypothetical protein